MRIGILAQRLWRQDGGINQVRIINAPSRRSCHPHQFTFESGAPHLSPLLRYFGNRNPAFHVMGSTCAISAMDQLLGAFRTIVEVSCKMVSDRARSFAIKLACRSHVEDVELLDLSL